MASYTTPKTWSTNEILTSPDMNTYVRDNTEYLYERVQSGTAGFTLTAANATGGTVNFGVTFVAAPVVILTVQIGSNLDVLPNITSTPTTTAFNWRVFTNSGSATSASGTLHWVAIGAVA